MTDRKAVIKNADMAEDMQQDAVDCATQVSETLMVHQTVIISFCILFVVGRNICPSGTQGANM